MATARVAAIVIGVAVIGVADDDVHDCGLPLLDATADAVVADG